MRIDCHSHVLPGIDDGSKNVEESLSMLRESARQGVSLMAATPHFYAQEQSIGHFLARRQHAWEKLKPNLEDQVPDILLGAEVHYFEGISANEDVVRLKLERTDLLLLEMPFRPWSQREISDVFELANRPDLTILMAHIERYFSTTPVKLWEQFRSLGILFQCNTEFFLNWRTRRKALRLVAQHQIDFLGSDCHNTTRRPPNLAGALDLIEKKLGADALREFSQREATLLGCID